LGPQPICNRFLSSADAEEFEFPMTIGVCHHCGLVQIASPVPPVELTPRFDWITYNEPERHLDGLAEFISRLPGLDEGPVVAGVSFKDDSMLARMNRLGFQHSWRIDPESDLKAPRPGVGVESIQDRLTPGAAEAAAKRYGPADIVLARHILEHAHHPMQFMEAVRKLARPDGYIVFELPDCQRALESGDYSTIWEEHVIYFTPETFRTALAYGGFPLAHFESQPYPLENCLIAVVKARNLQAPPLLAASMVRSEVRRAVNFGKALAATRKKWADFLSDFRQRQGGIAVFGAGHLACSFINLLGLREYVEFVVDDNSHKRGLFMPGSRLPILESPSLVERKIKLCLLCLSPESEEKVMQRNRAFVEGGGSFASVFPASHHALVI
jgi:hypothetical protein